MSTTEESLPGRESEAHLHLARIFLKSAELAPDATEVDVRNSLSRSYYALFHFCHAWLAYLGIPRGNRKQHEPLHHAISQRAGVEAKQRLQDFQRRREDADYRPGILHNDIFQGDIDRYRAFGNSSLQEIREAIIGYEKLIEIAGRKAKDESDGR